MKGRPGLIVAAIVLAIGLAMPAFAAKKAAPSKSINEKVDAQAEEIAKLREEVNALKQDKKSFDAGYDHGFFIRSDDKKFMFKIGLWTQLFYEYQLRKDAPDVSTFGIRRARFYFSGNMFSPKLTFAIMPELVTIYRTETSIYTTSSGDTVTINDRYDMNWRLLVLYAQYKFCEEFNARLGEFIPPTERYFRKSNLIFMGDLPIIATTEPFVAGYHIGADFFGTFKDKLTYDLFIVNGAGFDRLNINKSFLTGLRLTWNVMGKDDLSSSDLEYSEKPVVALSAFGAYDKADGNIPARGLKGDNTFRVGGDFAFKYKGFSFVPEAILFWNKSQHSKDYALTAQTGYFVIPKKLELAAQGSYINFSGVDNNRQEYSGGINYYFYGQPVKVQFDYSYLITDVPSGADQKDHRFRLNFQVGFF